MYGALAFGLGWRSDLPLHLFETAADAAADITVQTARELPHRGAVKWQGRVTTGFGDGLRLPLDGGTNIDVFGSDRVVVTPGPVWHGEMPVHFFSTIASAILASRGHLPIHGSALDIGGRAVLLCGKSGAGKSTLTAHLIALGAKLISDDLSVLVPGENPALLAGRPGIRLHPATAAWLSAQGKVEVMRPSYDHKVVVRPVRVPPHQATTLHRIFLLDREDTPLPPVLAQMALCAHMFRPRILARLAGQEARLVALSAVARKIGVTRVLGLHRYDQAQAMSRASEIWQLAG